MAGAEGILGTLRILVDADSSKAQKQLQAFGQQAATSTGQTAKAAQGAATQFRKAGAVIGGMAGMAAMGSIESSAVFQDQLRTINTVAKFSEDQLQKTGDGLQSMAVDFASTTTDMSGAFYDLVSAGIPAANAMDVLADSATLAKGGLATTGEGVDLMTSTLGAWNLEASDSAAVMQAWGQAVAAGKTTVAGLAGGISAVASIAASAGIEFQEIAAGTAQLTLTGDSASQAMTKQKAAIVALLTPNKTLLDLQAKSQKNYAAIAKDQGLHQAMQQMWEDSGRNQEAFAKMLGSSEALSYGLQVTGDNLGKYEGMLEGVHTAVLENTQAQDMMAEKMKSPVEQAKRMAAQLQGLGQDFGSLFGAIAPVVMTLNQLGPAMGGVTSTARLLAGGLGALAGGFSGRFLSLGKMAAGSFQKGFRAILGSALVGPVLEAVKSKLGPGMESMGKVMGGKFGTAFKAAGLLALGAMIVEGIAKLGEIRQANLEQVQKIDADLGAFLATAPTRAQVEEKLAALKGTPDRLEGIQRDIYNATDLAKGTVLGSVVDGLFGANPAQVVDEKVRVLEDYLKTVPAEAAQALATAAPMAAPAAQAAMEQTVVAPIRGAFRAATREVGRGFGSVRDALANPPKLVSKGKRIQSVTENLRKVMSNLRKAVAAEDPVNIAYWDRARAKLATRLDALKGKQSTTWADIKATYRQAGINIDGTWQKIKTSTDTKSGQAQEAAVDAAQDTKTGIDAVDLTSSGTAMMTELSNGIYAGIPAVRAASAAAAEAAAGPLRASSPPKMGPLKDIDTWGKPLIDAWVGPMERQAGRVAQVGARLAGALSPRASLGGGAALAGAGGWGGGVTIQAGVLVADDRGIDALDRKMRKRTRIRSRGVTRYNDPR